MRFQLIPLVVLLPGFAVPLAAPLAAQAEFLRGDADATGDITIADPGLILCALFDCIQPIPCLAAFDADGDARAEIPDAIYLLSFLFLGGPAPPPPFPAPGADPNGLPCDTYAPSPAPSDPRVRLAVRSKGFSDFQTFPAVVQLEGDMGAQPVNGWSFGLRTDASCSIVSATTDGTVAAEVGEGGLRNVGFVRTEITGGDEPGVVCAGGPTTRCGIVHVWSADHIARADTQTACHIGAADATHVK